jgi:hypothetical protein
MSGGGTYVLGRKSMLIAVLLSLFLGPIGVVYATFGTRGQRWAFVWLVLSVMLMFAVGLSLAPILLISVPWSVLAVRGINKQFR